MAGNGFFHYPAIISLRPKTLTWTVMTVHFLHQLRHSSGVSNVRKSDIVSHHWAAIEESNLD